jgi:hypothetical protein
MIFFAKTSIILCKNQPFLAKYFGDFLKIMIFFPEPSALKSKRISDGISKT